MRVGATARPQPHEMYGLRVLIIAPDSGTFKENSGDGLTVFLDFFLTKQNRERDVKKC